MEIRIAIERVTIRLTGENMANVFAIIAAAIAAKQAGDTSALQQHVSAIDAHLKNVDDEVLGLQSDDTSSKSRLDAIEQGLQTVADTVAPASAPSGDGSGTAANPGGGSDTGAVSGTGPDAGNPGGAPDPGATSGSGADAGNPGGSADGSASAPADGSQSGDVSPDGPSAHASAPIPSSGVGSETTGQVDTPTTIG